MFNPSKEERKKNMIEKLLDGDKIMRGESRPASRMEPTPVKPQTPSTAQNCQVFYTPNSPYYNDIDALKSKHMY